MTPLELSLAAAGLLIGVTGAWSPCGFSMVETLGPTGHSGGRRTTTAACAAFALGAPLGGMVTFGLLAAAGGLLHGTGGRAAYLAAAAIAVAAALGEARGVPIVPQIRRQLPEHWRRVMPMPLAGGLYGVLLGLGFTTFVLSLGVWALAGVSLALGDVGLGLLTGAAFGVGRLLPVVALAPIVNTPVGNRAAAAMAERPAIYYGFRACDAAALLALALALVSAPHAVAARSGLDPVASTASTAGAKLLRRDASDPVTEDRTLVLQRGDQVGLLRRRGGFERLAGTDPTIGGPYVAVLRRGHAVVLRRRDLRPVARMRLRGVREVAISGRWLAWLAEAGKGRQVIRARRIRRIRSPGRVRTVAVARPPARLSRPSLSGRWLVYARATRRRNAIRLRSLTTRRGRTVVVSRSHGLRAPAIAGRKLLYVRVTRRRQQLRIQTLGRHQSRVLYARKRRHATFWTSALAPRRAYLTLLRFSGRGRGHGRVISVRR